MMSQFSFTIDWPNIRASQGYQMPKLKRGVKLPPLSPTPPTPAPPRLGLSQKYGKNYVKLNKKVNISWRQFHVGKAGLTLILYNSVTKRLVPYLIPTSVTLTVFSLFFLQNWIIAEDRLSLQNKKSRQRRMTSVLFITTNFN